MGITEVKVRARGVRMGHHSTVPASTKRSIARLRAKATTWQGISDKLNADRVPTPVGGGQWNITKVLRHHGAGENR